MHVRRFLLVLVGLLATIALVAVPTAPDRARDGAAPVSRDRSARTPHASRPTGDRELAADTPSEETGSAHVRVDASPTAATGDWSIAGHVRHGTYGVLPDAPLRITIYAGRVAEGDSLVEARIRSDEKGTFTWSTIAPAETVTVVVIPELEGYKVGASTRTVLHGDPGPGDLEPYAYALDVRIAGRVADEQGNAVADALVYSHLSEVRTDAEGHYVLPMHSKYPAPTIRVMAAGYAVESFAVGFLRPGEAQGPDVVLRKERTVRGRVLDAAGAPILGATVSSHPHERLRTTTSDTGHYRLGGLDPSQEQIRISASMKGFVSVVRTLETGAQGDGGEAELDLVLERGARVSGRVVGERGVPVPNAIVCWGDHPNSSGPRATSTDAAGEFELDGVPTGSESIWALRKGYAADRITVAVPGAGAALSDVELVLRSGFEIAGRVLDEADRPIAEAEVRPEAIGTGRGDYAGDSAITDSDGRFVLRDLRTEQVSVRVFAVGRAAGQEVLRVGADAVIRLAPTGGLAGLVVDGATGLPIDAFTVRFVPPRLEPGEPVLTRFGGAWHQSGMSFRGTAGRWDSSPEALTIGCITSIEVSAPGYATTLLERAVVTAAPEPEDLRIELHAGVVVRGSVVDATTGAPIPNARVRCFPGGYRPELDREDPAKSGRTNTDEHGRFELSRVPPGTVVLIVDETGLAPYTDGPFEVPSHVLVLERTIEVSAGGRLVGRYLDEHGSPLIEQSISLNGLDQPTRERARLTAITDSEGRFEFAGLAPGQYHLRGELVAPAPDAGASLLRLVRVEDGQTLDFDLRPTGHSTLEGTLEYTGELPENLQVDLLPAKSSGEWAAHVVGAAIHGSSFTASGLEAGEWILRAMAQTDDGGMIHGGGKVQIPESGVATANIKLRLVGQ